jgi:alpha-mannosidase
VGWLSRGDLFTRRGHAGPPYETPEAQCIGRHRFEYAIYIYQGTLETARVWEMADTFCAPPMGVCLTSLGKGDLPQEACFLEIEPSELVLSAIKWAEDGTGLIVRLYNPIHRNLFGMVTSFWPLSHAELASLDEQPQATLPLLSPHAIQLTVRSGEIKTVRLQFAHTPFGHEVHR